MPGSPPVFETFRGDFDEVAALLQDAWVEAGSGNFRYEADFLRTAYSQPGTQAGLSPTLYERDIPVAFLAAFPRNVLLRSRPLRLVCLTLFTCARSLRGRGVGTQLWAEGLRRARSAGYDGCVYFHRDGVATGRIAAAAAAAIGCVHQHLMSFRYLGRPLTEKDRMDEFAGAGEVRVDDFRQLANQVARAVQLGRLWSPEESAWECAPRGGRVLAGSADAMLAGSVMPLLDAGNARVAVVDSVLMQALPAAGQAMLLREFLARAMRQGAGTAVVPLLQYADTAAFREQGFRKSLRVMHACMTLFDASIPQGELESICLDVL